MGVSSSIQFRGKDQVMQAFQNRNASAWALWQGKQFLLKGIDEGELGAYLDILLRSGSEAIYTLKIFDDITDVKKIKSNTEDDGSFNFRLFDPQEGGIGRAAYGGSSMSAEMAALNEKIDKLILARELEAEEIEDEAEEPSIIGIITGLLKEPDKLEKIIKVGRTLLGMEASPGFVGNVNRLDERTPAPSLSPSENPSVEFVEYTAEQMKMLQESIDVLALHDPKLPEHLHKLATMATGNKKNFLSLVSMIEIV